MNGYFEMSDLKRRFRVWHFSPIEEVECHEEEIAAGQLLQLFNFYFYFNCETKKKKRIWVCNMKKENVFSNSIEFLSFEDFHSDGQRRNLLIKEL